MTLSATPATAAELSRLAGLPDAAAADFPVTAPAANPVFYRTYSRKTPNGRESWQEVSERNLEGLRKLGNLNAEEVALLRRMQKRQ